MDGFAVVHILSPKQTKILKAQERVYLSFLAFHVRLVYFSMCQEFAAIDPTCSLFLSFLLAALLHVACSSSYFVSSLHFLFSSVRVVFVFRVDVVATNKNRKSIDVGVIFCAEIVSGGIGDYTRCESFSS